jgi:pSer/pThr/pTyr-binding forkhead associated (FHA) protein
MIYSTAERLRQPVEEAGGRRSKRAIVLAEGKRFAVAPAGASIGRSRECDIVLGDANVSRRHAEVRPGRTSEATWTIEDLGSTNGVRVNGRAAAGAYPLSHGDRIELGTADLMFELE